MRLTVAALKAFREQLLIAQGGKCALCGEACSLDEAVTDHDHKTGVIRGVLHRGCNAMLGHLENNRPRNYLTNIRRFTAFLRNVVPYLYARRDDPVLYPSYRTPDEKRDLRNKRLRNARAAKRKAQ